jgi:hypothetical protein
LNRALQWYTSLHASEEKVEEEKLKQEKKFNQKDCTLSHAVQGRIAVCPKEGLEQSCFEKGRQKTYRSQNAGQEP